MASMQSIFTWINDVTGMIVDLMWGPSTFIVLLGLGIVLSIWSKLVQFRALTHGVQVVRGKYSHSNDPGAINHFQALSTALSGTVGLGNIGGVAMAIGIGGPGALFWMWMVGFLGMAIKSVEVTLSMMYRDTSDPDEPHGGPMYVITRGWGDKAGGWRKLAAKAIASFFCVTLILATITGGNMFQCWNVGNITNQYFGIPQVACGITIAVVAGLVIIGGIKRIGDVTGLLVPMMCGLYLLAGIVVLFVKAANIPSLLLQVVQDAFTPTEATGAFIGATAWFGLTTGLRRAVFSNEAGQGSSPIAHSAAKTDEPVREGVVAGLEPFIDTCMVCTLTALVILSTGTWNREAVGQFAGEVRIEQFVEADATSPGNSKWQAVGSTNFDHLPPLAAPDYWAVGNRFFLLAEQESADGETGSRVIKIEGEISAADNNSNSAASTDPATPPQLMIKWKETGEIEGESPRLLSLDVYSDLSGAALTGHAFDRAIPGLGKWLVTFTAWLFAISTIISWSYYGEQGTVYLFGQRMVMPYKAVYCLLAVVSTLPGFIPNDKALSNLVDLGTGAMLIANVPIVIFMAPRAIRAFRDYFGRLDRGEMAAHAPPSIADVMAGDDE